MGHEKSDSDILDALDLEGYGGAVDRELTKLLEAAPKASAAALLEGFRQALEGSIPLSEAWDEYAQLIDANHVGRGFLEAGNTPRDFMNPDAARRLFWMSRLVPVLLLGHSLRAWRAGRHDAAIGLLQRAADLIAASRVPDAIRFSASTDARFKAQKRHKENRDFKAYAISYYQANRARFKSKNEAAEEIVQKIIPGTSFRVARRWLNGV